MNRVQDSIVDLLNMPSFIARRRASCDSQRSCTSKTSKCSEGASSVASSSTDIYCIEQLTDFQNVVNSDVTLDLFRRYLEEIHCEECLNFYLDVEQFKDQCDQLNCQSVKYERARRIYDNFININSGLCTAPVNIDAESRRHIQDAIESNKLTSHMFNQAQSEMLRMIKFDLLPRFIKAEVKKRRNSEDGKENQEPKVHRKSFFRVLRNAIMPQLEGRMTPKSSVVSMHDENISTEFSDVNRNCSVDGLALRRNAIKFKTVSSDERSTWQKDGRSGPQHANSVNLRYSIDDSAYQVDDGSISRACTLQKLASVSKELLFRARYSKPPYRQKIGHVASVDDCVHVVAFNTKQPAVDEAKVSKNFQNTLSSLLLSPLLMRRNTFDKSGQRRRQLHKFESAAQRRRGC